MSDKKKKHTAFIEFASSYQNVLILVRIPFSISSARCI